MTSDGIPEAKIATLEFIRALARHSARIDAARGVRWEAIDHHAKSPSPETLEGVKERIDLALESLAGVSGRQTKDGVIVPLKRDGSVAVSPVDKSLAASVSNILP